MFGGHIHFYRYFRYRYYAITYLKIVSKSFAWIFRSGHQPVIVTAEATVPVATVEMETTGTELATEARDDFIYDDSGIGVPSSMQQLDSAAGARQQHAYSDLPDRPTSGVRHDDVAVDTGVRILYINVLLLLGIF